MQTFSFCSLFLLEITSQSCPWREGEQWRYLRQSDFQWETNARKGLHTHTPIRTRCPWFWKIGNSQTWAHFLTTNRILPSKRTDFYLCVCVTDPGVPHHWAAASEGTLNTALTPDSERQHNDRRGGKAREVNCVYMQQTSCVWIDILGM